MLCGRSLCERGLPRDYYGFDFHDETCQSDEESSRKRNFRFPDVPITLKNGCDFTHRFMAGDYEFEMIKIIHGETYQGSGSEVPTKDTTVVGKIGGFLFDFEEYYSESFFESADSVSQELIDDISALFDYDGRPKNTFRTKVKQGEYCKILYISQLFVATESRGQCLGMEMVRAMICQLQNTLEYCPDLIVIDDHWDDPPELKVGPPSEGCVEKALDVYRMHTKDYLYEQLGFKNIAERGKQSYWKFLEPFGTMRQPYFLGNKIRVANPKKRQVSGDETNGVEENERKHDTVKQINTNSARGSDEVKGHGKKQKSAEQQHQGIIQREKEETIIDAALERRNEEDLREQQAMFEKISKNEWTSEDFLAMLSRVRKRHMEAGGYDDIIQQHNANLAWDRGVKGHGENQAQYFGSK